MLLTNSESRPGLDASYIRLFEQRRVDGLILSLTSETHAETNDLLAQLDVPCVVVDRDIATSVRVSRVLYDHQTACGRRSGTSSTSGIVASTSSSGRPCDHRASGGSASRPSSR